MVLSIQFWSICWNLQRIKQISDFWKQTCYSLVRCKGEIFPLFKMYLGYVGSVWQTLSLRLRKPGILWRDLEEGYCLRDVLSPSSAYTGGREAEHEYKHHARHHHYNSTTHSLHSWKLLSTVSRSISTVWSWISTRDSIPHITTLPTNQTWNK